MIALVMIVGHILRNRVAKRCLPEENHPIQTFILCLAAHQMASSDYLDSTRLARLQPLAPMDSWMRVLRRMSSPVYGADFLPRAAKVRGRNLRSPRITYTT